MVIPLLFQEAVRHIIHNKRNCTWSNTVENRDELLSRAVKLEAIVDEEPTINVPHWTIEKLAITGEISEIIIIYGTVCLPDSTLI